LDEVLSNSSLVLTFFEASHLGGTFNYIPNHHKFEVFLVFIVIPFDLVLLVSRVLDVQAVNFRSKAYIFPSGSKPPWLVRRVYNQQGALRSSGGVHFLGELKWLRSTAKVIYVEV
jgi:hypothetical protein